MQILNLWSSECRINKNKNCGAVVKYWNGNLEDNKLYFKSLSIQFIDLCSFCASSRSMKSDSKCQDIFIKDQHGTQAN